MPLYDFECEECKHIEEDIICSSAQIEKSRPVCCGKSMKSLIGVPGKAKVWNMDPATQTGEENARMCGVPI